MQKPGQPPRANLAPFEEELILPAQWAEEVPAETGERKLLRAVLEDALRDLRDPNGEYYAEAVAWFAATTTGSLFDFNSICDVLGFNSEIFRRELAARGTAIAHMIQPRCAAPRLRLSITEDTAPTEWNPFGLRNR